MIALALLSLALGAPAFHAEGGLPAEAEAAAERAWDEEAALLLAEGLSLPQTPRPIRLLPAPGLPPGEAGLSLPGLIRLREGLPGLPGRPGAPGPGALTLRHEVAHQLLFEACPAASGDRLFHEAFAVAVSGELPSWAAGEEEGRYLSLSAAVATLSRARDQGGPGARRALARLLAEAPTRPGRLPAPLARLLTRCEAGSTWAPLRPEDLASDVPSGDALVVLSRHTGEVLLAEGEVRALLPFGSTLKPFLLAGARRPPPKLPPDPGRPVWRCGGALPALVDSATALIRSCNGWFMDWAATEPEVLGFGTYGQALLALGLTGLPSDAAEAIGVRPALRIAPLGLAHAYRLLAEARPDLMDVLSRNAREGTLSGLPASDALAGTAVKSGTVLDADARPKLGLLVAVTEDVVVVLTRAGRTPRTFASELVTALARARAPAREAARVQVLGLLPLERLMARCRGKGFAAAATGPLAAEEDFAPLEDLARKGPLVCAGGPWLIRYPGLAEPRPYAGVLSFERAPDPPAPAEGAPVLTPREARARRGSDLILRTTRLAYATGVVEAEDGRLRGEARIALARVADRNASTGGRHPGRPPCDTTHCQAFRGTAAPRPEDRVALMNPLPPGPWLPFSKGGDEPWAEERPAVAVVALLGPGARDLSFGGGRVSFLALGGDPGSPFEERRSLPCEALRGPLHLPSCPHAATAADDHFRFEGRGEGHGEGLDLEEAQRSALPAGEILEQAYGAAGR